MLYSMRVYSGLCSALIRDVGAREADVSQISSRLGEERVTMYSSGRPGCGHSRRRLRCRRLLSGLPQLGGNVNWMWSSEDGELNGFTRQSRLGAWWLPQFSHVKSPVTHAQVSLYPEFDPPSIFPVQRETSSPSAPFLFRPSQPQSSKMMATSLENGMCVGHADTFTSPLSLMISRTFTPCASTSTTVQAAFFSKASLEIQNGTTGS